MEENQSTAGCTSGGVAAARRLQERLHFARMKRFPCLDVISRPEIFLVDQFARLLKSRGPGAGFARWQARTSCHFVRARSRGKRLVGRARKGEPQIRFRELER